MMIGPNRKSRWSVVSYEQADARLSLTHIASTGGAYGRGNQEGKTGWKSAAVRLEMDGAEVRWNSTGAGRAGKGPFFTDGGAETRSFFLKKSGE